LASGTKDLDGLESIVGKLHVQILKKFLALSGQVITDSTKLRGRRGISKIPPDNIVSEPHYLHNLVRGVYKPKGDDYALSILTNPKSKWGQEVDFETGKWTSVDYDFDDGKKYAADMRSLSKCHKDGIPVGIIYKRKKGENQIFGLGKIVKIQGTKFEIVPF